MDLATWTALPDNGWSFPSDRSAGAVADELGMLLCSPDPSLRDDIGFTALARWVSAGDLDGALVRLGDAAADRLTHPDVQARSFAALTLAVVLRRRGDVGDVVPLEAVERWCDAFLQWYPAERDTRGWDDELGWLHAVAHGADTVAAFARHLPHRRDELLDACARRIVNGDGDVRYVQLEDARLARALVEVLSDPDVTERQATAWLDRVEAAFADAGPGPVPVWAFNTFATLQSLHLHLARGLVQPLTDAGRHAEAVADRVVAILRGPYPWLA
ncbi:MAG: DUF2785 domain-containing protein [Angustibacter sp.]